MRPMTEARTPLPIKRFELALRLTLVVLTGWPMTGHAAPDASSACEQTANDTAKRLNSASIDKASEKPGEYVLSQSDGTKLRFSCPVDRQRFPRLSLSWQAIYPPRAFWDQVSHAGAAMTSASLRRVDLAAHQCHKAAMLAEPKRSAIRQKGLGIECQVTTGQNPLTSVTLHQRSNRRSYF